MGSVNFNFVAVSIDLVLFLVATLAALLLVRWTMAPDWRQAAFMLMRIMLIGVVAARAFHIYLNAEDYARAPWTVARLTDGGFIIFAGFLATIVATAWYAWRHRTLRHSLVLAVFRAYSA